MGGEQRARELAGDEVASHCFGLRTIRVYEHGYVRIGPIGALRAPLERLISIAAATDLAGANGNVYLTIVTDRKTHELQESATTSGDVQAAMALDQVGNDAIAWATRR